MSRILFVCLAVLLNLSPLGVYGQNPNPSASVDAAILSEMNAEKFPGVSTIIVKDGEIIWVESYGFADVQNAVPVEDTTVFLLASMSKVFTGTASMQAYEAGIIDLDAGVSNYLTWPLEIPNHFSDSVTVRDLMTHSSSIDDNGPVMDIYYDYPDPSISLGDCIERYFSLSGADYDPVNNFIDAAPGTTYSYSNMATALNGFITESATGVPFDQFCDANIFAPLCMEKTAWHFADFDSADVARPYAYQAGSYVPYPHYGFADYPDGQLRSTVVDIGNFMIAYLNGGTFGANNILTPASINEMWSSQIPSLDATQGLNWYQEQLFHSGGTSMLWGHNGGENGVSTDMYVDPINNIGICVLTNGEGDALYICDELYDYALSLSPTASITPSCLTNVELGELAGQDDLEIVKIFDFMGRETTLKSNTPLIILYSDGSTKRTFQFEE
ncbi:MAG: CubicO group peptidase (beta-lactamase class C family) [Crocinitomicaceae bacterium]|jgi:CubicO group peptidase (beta-lactamase class C family)